MRVWRIKISPISMQLTQWDADTLFGSLCWTLRYLDGEEALNDFLMPYLEGNPPYLISNGVPADRMPFPYHVRLLHSEEFSDPASYKLHKLRKKERFLFLEEFNKSCRGEAVQVTEESSKLIENYTQMHASINRLSGTTTGSENEGEASLYQLPGWIPGKKTDEFHVYIADRKGEGIERVVDLFRKMALTGFGKKKSSGYGAFRIDSDPEEWEPPVSPEEANGFVTLSGFVPKQSDPTKGFWQTRVKHGKLGEEYATGGKPFKKPWILLEAGSVFYSKDRPGEVYGRMLKNLSDDYPNVVQYAYAFPIPIKFPDELIESA